MVGIESVYVVNYGNRTVSCQGVLMELLVSFGERLREERERLRLNQTAFAAAGGVTKKTQMLYESGERFPDIRYLAAVQEIGCDTHYIVTGLRDGAAPVTLTSDEQLLLERYRASPAALRDAALRVLLGGDVAPKHQGQVFNGPVGQPINLEGNLSQSGISFFGRGEKKG